MHMTKKHALLYSETSKWLLEGVEGWGFTFPSLHPSTLFLARVSQKRIPIVDMKRLVFSSEKLIKYRLWSVTDEEGLDKMSIKVCGAVGNSLSQAKDPNRHPHFSSCFPTTTLDCSFQHVSPYDLSFEPNRFSFGGGVANAFSIIQFYLIYWYLDIFWSDPDPQNRKGCRKNDARKIACFFGPDVTEEFLKKYNLSMIIRSHQVKQEGYEFTHDGKVLTIFSASNYCGGSNWGAVVRWFVAMKTSFFF